MARGNNNRGQQAWRRDPVVLARLIEVERRHLRRQPNTHIAAALGVAEVTVRRDIERLRELWLERTQAAQAELRAQVVAELDDTAERALAAAEFDERAERAVLFGQDADGNAVQVQRDDKGSAAFRGNKAQALNVRRQATMDKAKVLGLIVDKQEPVGESLVRIYVRDTAPAEPPDASSA